VTIVKPTWAHSLASSKMMGVSATGWWAPPSCTRWFRSFQSDHATSQTKVSKPFWRAWKPCVVRGLFDGRFLVWWVIDNVVWTDSWLSITGAGWGLTGVGAGEEQARKVMAGETSMFGEDK
jgi:hypothetical protein